MIKNRVKQYRKQRGLTQIDLARQTGLTRQTIGLIESGKYNPSLKACLKIAAVLFTGLDALFNPNSFDD